MQINKLMKAALAASVAVFLSASAGAQQPAGSAAPTSKDVMAAAIKAHRGEPDAFDNSRAYSWTRAFVIDEGGKDQKSGECNCTYKGRKYHMEGSVLIKRQGRPFKYEAITDLDKNEQWESENGGAYKKGPMVYNLPDVPITGNREKVFNDLSFISETPLLVKQDNEEFYKVDVEFTDPQFKDWTRTYLINKKSNLISEMHQTSAKESIRQIVMYKDYAKAGNAMIPQKILHYGSTKKNEKPALGAELTISSFKFRDDIPDSLFVVPKK